MLPSPFFAECFDDLLLDQPYRESAQVLATLSTEQFWLYRQFLKASCSISTWFRSAA
jgi:hypothetical protein